MEYNRGDIYVWYLCVIFFWISKTELWVSHVMYRDNVLGKITYQYSEHKHDKRIHAEMLILVSVMLNNIKFYHRWDWIL